MRIIRKTLFVAVVVGCLAAAFVGGRALLERIDSANDEEPTEAAEVKTSVADVRDLRVEYVATGTVQYSDAVAATSPVAGTVLDIVSTGSTLQNGSVLAVVDEQPIVWLDGEMPAWRSLESGDEGVDVLQLETALTALGFNSDADVTVDEEYTYATSQMVKEWQESIGADETGKVGLGTVRFGADRTRVASVSVAVGDDISEGSTLLEIGAPTRYATLDAEPAAAVTLDIGGVIEVDLPDNTQVQGTISDITAASETWTVTVLFDDRSEFPSTDVVNVEMTWEQAIVADALTIPSAALLRLDSGIYVVDVIDGNGDATRTPVDIGTAVGTRVEITGGLQAGSVVVTL